MNKRCMYELKTEDIDKAAEQMLTETENSMSIEVPELS
jgi:hypothetical protein